MLKKLFSGTILFVFLFVGSVLSEQRGAFSTVGGGARPLGMGGAFVGIGDSPDAIYWNPAGLSQLGQRQVLFTHTDLFGMNIKQNWLTLVQPVGEKMLGFGYNSLNLGEGFELGYREGSYLLGLSGFKFIAGQSFLWGANLKYNFLEGGSTLVNTKDQGVGVDVGLLWQNSPCQVGLVIRDLYTKLTGTLKVEGEDRERSYSLKPDVALGLAYKVNNTTWAFDLGELITSPKVHVGVEFALNDLLKVRGGYNAGSLTAGLGIRKGGVLIDYAYNSHEAGNAHRFSLGFQF